MICSTCDDKGCVCEAHADRPWGDFNERHDVCACSAGSLCGGYAAPIGVGSFATLIREAFRPGAGD